MKKSRFLTAALLGLTLGFAHVPDTGVAESLRVVKRGTSSTLSVPMNRAVVVESDSPFAELSIANPQIADISSLSGHRSPTSRRFPTAPSMSWANRPG